MLFNLRFIFPTSKQFIMGMIAIMSFTQGVVLAQSGPGKLTGKITDSTTNESLANVNVSARGTSSGTATITDGTYILNLPAGTYTIIFSSANYNAKEISGVVIKSKETTFQDILLSRANTELGGVIVRSTVSRESQSSVYSAQKRSSAASDGISQDVIRKTPDNTAGQILKRVTGLNVQDNRFVVVRGLADQYNQTMLNGVPMTSTETDRNAFAFDLIPASVIDNITVNKTATPDMPGNFAGGIVQVNTKDFPADDFISVSLQLAFFDETIGKDFLSDKRAPLEWLGSAGHIRDLPDGFPTSKSRVTITQMNNQERFRYLKMLKNNIEPVNQGPSRLNENLQLGYGKTFKLKNGNQVGIVMAINQRKTELIEHETSLREPQFNIPNSADPPGTPNVGLFGYYSENLRFRYTADFGGVVNFAYRFGNNKITLKNLYVQSLNNQFLYRPYVRIDNFDILPGSLKDVGLTYLVENRKLFNTILAGEHRVGKGNETRLDWNINVTTNNIEQPDTRNFIFHVDSSMTHFTTDNNADFEQSLARYTRIWSDLSDFTYGGAFNITSPFNLRSQKQLLKSGILFQNRQRKATGTVLPISNLTGTIDSVLDPSHFYPGGGEIVVSTTALAGDAGNYDASSSLLAAYASLENRLLNKLRVIWGLRVENYQQSVNVYRSFYYDNFQDPELGLNQFAARTTFNFLPSVNLIYSPLSTINIRGAFSNTVIRPELKDLAQYRRYDFQTFTVSQGNGELRSTFITNLDLKFEYFPSAGEIMSFAAFYKKIDDPIEYARATASNANNIRVSVNTGRAYVKGVEFEVRKKLDFTGIQFLRNWTLFGNGALIESKVRSADLDNSLVTSTTEHTLTGQPKYIINAGLSIAALKNTLEFTTSYNRTGDYINELGTSDLILNRDGNMVPTLPHFRVKARDVMDLVVSKTFLRNKMRVKFNISNLLKSRYILYQDLNGNGRFDQAVRVKQVSGSSQSVYSSGQDNAASSIDPQRSYSLTFSYTF